MVLAQNRDFFFCEFCRSFQLPKASSDRIRVLDESASDIKCSVCRSPLYQASIGGYRGLKCKKCGGILMDQSTFREMINYLRASAEGPPEQPQPLNREELQGQIRCPYCGATMDRHPYYGPGSIVIDTCSQCSIIWLDYKELDIVIDAPGSDRGS